MGLRLPTTIGQTVGVVAGIVLGQAAISANLASPGIIIVIVITTICTFSMPNYSMVLAVLSSALIHDIVDFRIWFIWFFYWLVSDPGSFS